MKKDNITFIGMPGSGKSTISKLLAKELNFELIDCDKYIEKKEKKSLHQIIDNKGDDFFLKIEEKRILELLPLKKSILDPGGSIIYSSKTMNRLKKFSVIVFLNVSFKIIKERLTNKTTRGIIGLKSKSIMNLYKERIPLYKKYADITINCNKKSNKEIINEIIKK